MTPLEAHITTRAAYWELIAVSSRLKKACFDRLTPEFVDEGASQAEWQPTTSSTVCYLLMQDRMTPLSRAFGWK